MKHNQNHKMVVEAVASRRGASAVAAAAAAATKKAASTEEAAAEVTTGIINLSFYKSLFKILSHERIFFIHFFNEAFAINLK
jgi:hypothetical protein